MKNDVSVKSILGKREGDFSNILKILQKGQPARPTLFEFFHNPDLYGFCCGQVGVDADGLLEIFEDPFISLRVPAFVAMGYDYVTMPANQINFAGKQRDSKASCSMSHGGAVTDWKSFEEFHWPDVNDCGADFLELFSPFLPDSMKFIVNGPCGVLENVVQLVGYEDLCLLMFDDPQLVDAIFTKVGQTLVDYYSQAVQHERVGAIISNDDWGFNTQTMLATADMRRLVFPWHKEIVAVAHAAGKPAILHSCGQLAEVYEDIIEDMKFDGKHSYEDKIQPVEQAYEKYKGRLAILGGLDLDFVCRADSDAIYRRAKDMLERSESDGG
ncbi:MAG TPA: uroporphyrinogen decarboxylase family protein, partial [Phycisphaerae bacterium]|nr:uroporphyrinogen decarboxylase family protein [Phycisphaerae bacterium]